MRRAHVARTSTFQCEDDASAMYARSREAAVGAALMAVTTAGVSSTRAITLATSLVPCATLSHTTCATAATALCPSSRAGASSSSRALARATEAATPVKHAATAVRVAASVSRPRRAWRRRRSTDGPSAEAWAAVKSRTLSSMALHSGTRT